MITVVVDSQQLQANIGGLKTMGDLVELVKASIDPDTIITSLTIAGKPLTDNDWQMPLSVHSDSVLQVTTGEKGAYVAERLAVAPDYLDQITAEFSSAAQAYRSGDAAEGNKYLAMGVDNLLAFLNWYVALLSIESAARAGQIAEFQGQLQGVKEICEQLVQQQLYHSWWMLGETIQQRLLPILGNLRQFCVKNSGAPAN